MEGNTLDYALVSDLPVAGARPQCLPFVKRLVASQPRHPAHYPCIPNTRSEFVVWPFRLPPI
jgi:hypothetical protein